MLLEIRDTVISGDMDRERAQGSAAVRQLKASAMTQLVKSSRELAVLPPAATKLLQLSQDPRTDLRQIAGVARTDPGLTGKILSVANSPIYATRFSTAVTSIEKALGRIGLEAMKAIVIQTSVSGRVLRLPGMEAAIRAISRHAVFTATTARAIARIIGLDPEQAFTVGLLHDVGKIVGYEAYARASTKDKQGISLDVRGLAPVLQLVHEEIGAHVAKSWTLPEVVQEAIGHHHTLGARHVALQLPLLTRVADLIAHQLDPDAEREAVEVREQPEVYQLGLDPGAVEKVLASVPVEASGLASALA